LLTAVFLAYAKLCPNSISMTIPTPPTVTIRETITSTLSASSSTTGQPLPTQGHPFPHAFPFAGQPPPIGYMPPIFPTGGSPPIVAGQPGTLVSPFAAVLCILTVAGCYWGFRYLPQMQQQAINVSQVRLLPKNGADMHMMSAFIAANIDIFCRCQRF
jgi:hypothetical protein